MARPWRIQFEDAVYHISVRGNNKQNIFADDGDQKFFLELLGRARDRFGLKIFAFCLMSNHFHLFLQTPRANLSRAMQWLNATYTGRFNWRHRRSGHLFQGRYHSVLVVDEAHWSHLSMYIHLNPVRGGIVRDPAKYPWSSCRDYMSVKSRFNWLEKDTILSGYGSSRAAQIRRYGSECLAMIGAKPAFISQLQNGIILGSREAVDKLVKKYRPAGKVADVAQYSAAARKEIDAKHELKRVACLFGVEVKDLMRKRRNFPPRLAAYYHLVQGCGLSTSDAAKNLGVSTPTVSLGVRRFETKLGKNKTLQIKMRQLNYK